jgi:predicted transcriptional regulator
VKVFIGDDEFSRQLDKAIWKDPDSFAGQRLIVMKPELFPKIITVERLRLLKALEKNPKSMGELAKILDRPREAVSRDFKKLEFWGLVEFERRGKTKVPSRVGEISVTV